LIFYAEMLVPEIMQDSRNCRLARRLEGARRRNELSLVSDVSTAGRALPPAPAGDGSERAVDFLDRADRVTGQWSATRSSDVAHGDVSRLHSIVGVINEIGGIGP
jgi:hypothetical protein